MQPARFRPQEFETAYRRKPSEPFAVHRSASCDHGIIASSVTVCSFVSKRGQLPQATPTVRTCVAQVQFLTAGSRRKPLLQNVNSSPRQCRLTCQRPISPVHAPWCGDAEGSWVQAKLHCAPSAPKPVCEVHRSVLASSGRAHPRWAHKPTAQSSLRPGLRTRPLDASTMSAGHQTTVSRLSAVRKSAKSQLTLSHSAFISINSRCVARRFVLIADPTGRRAGKRAVIEGPSPVHRNPTHGFTRRR
jgi:hypothetical protein